MSPHSSQSHVVILGAGLGGLSSGWTLSKSGYSVCLLEKTSQNGGLAVTKERDGFRYDLGPHNIHTRHAHILAFLQKNLPSLYEYFPTARILKRGKLVTYPISGTKVLTSLSLWKLPFAALGFAAARARMYLGRQGSDRSFRDWIVNRFGALIYREYFHHYPSKVWKLPTHDIDRHVAEMRIPITGLLDVVKACFRKTADKPQRLVDRSFYLKSGVGEMVHHFEKGLRATGGRIENQITLTKILTKDSRVVAVEYTDASGKPKSEDCDFLLSTIPINELIPLFEDVPERVLQAATELEYCASVLLFVKVARREVLPSTVLYFTEPSVLFSRLSDLSRFSADMAPPGKSLLCLECPCAPGDTTWEMGDHALLAHAVEALAARGLLNPDEVEGGFTERIGHSYPRFRLGFGEKVKACFDFLSSFKNTVSFGRQGGYKYVNTDSVMQYGFLAASSVMMAQPTGYSCSEWFQAHDRG